MKKKNQSELGFTPNETHHPDGNRASRRTVKRKSVVNNRGNFSVLFGGMIKVRNQFVNGKTIQHLTVRTT